MLNISSYLKKITDKIDQTKEKKDFILKKINDICGIKIEPENLEIKENIIKINTSPAKKNIIFIKKDSILSSIKKERGELFIDIL